MSWFYSGAAMGLRALICCIGAWAAFFQGELFVALLLGAIGLYWLWASR